MTSVLTYFRGKGTFGDSLLAPSVDTKKIAGTPFLRQRQCYVRAVAFGDRSGDRLVSSRPTPSPLNFCVFYDSLVVRTGHSHCEVIQYRYYVYCGKAYTRAMLNG